MKITNSVKWVTFAVAIILATTLMFYVRGCSLHDQRIAQLNNHIKSLEEESKASESRANAALSRASQAEKDALEKEAEAQRERERGAIIERERNALRERIASKTPTEIVERTREILVCTEITLTNLGIVFSEACARANLMGLEDVPYIKAELKSAKSQIDLHLGEIKDLKNSILNKNTTLYEKDIQLGNKDEAIADINEKLRQEKLYGRSKTIKSFLTGTVIGIGITVIVYSLVKK